MKALAAFPIHPVLLGTAMLLTALPAGAQATSAQTTSAPVSTPQNGPICVLLTDDGGLDAQNTRALRSLAISALRKQGYAVSDDPSLEGLHPAGEATLALMRKMGGRTLSLRVAGRLGTKLPMVLEELNSGGGVLTSVSMTSASIEECDIVVPRMVEALLTQKPVESTARMATVTTEEARPFLHRPGDNHFVIGMLGPLFSGEGESGKSGISLGYLYSAEHFMLGIEGLYAHSGRTNIGSTVFFHGEWLPLDGDFSPYLGGGIGYLGGQDGDADITYGLAYKLTAGIELFRLRHLRVQVGLDVYFPSSGNRTTVTRWNSSGTDTEEIKARSSYPVMHVKVAF